MRRFDIEFYNNGLVCHNLKNCDDYTLEEVVDEHFYGWTTNGERQDIKDEIFELKVNEEYEYFDWKEVSGKFERNVHFKIARTK